MQMLKCIRLTPMQLTATSDLIHSKLNHAFKCVLKLINFYFKPGMVSTDGVSRLIVHYEALRVNNAYAGLASRKCY